MYEINRSNRFKKSYKRIFKSGFFDVEEFERIISCLISDNKLSDSYRDHALKGDYFGLRECHIKGDCLLIYEIDVKYKVIYLVDIGNHANLF